MFHNLNVQPVATAIILVVVVVAGAVVTITHPDTLPFTTYLRDVGSSAGLLAIGRGLSLK